MQRSPRAVTEREILFQSYAAHKDLKQQHENYRQAPWNSF